MEKSQFIFSLCVGFMLMAMGALVATKASVGIALAAVGAFTAALAVNGWRRSGEAQGQSLLVPVQGAGSE